MDLEDVPQTAAESQNPRDGEQTLDAERLRSAIRRLTDERAEVVSLWRGYSIAEVAGMMNRTGLSRPFNIARLQHCARSCYDQML